jgi:cytochrome P450
MALYSTAAVLILAATIAIFIYRSTRSAPARAPPECKPAKRYPHLDPIFGLDLLLITIVNMFRSNHIAAVAARHKKYGPTFSITNVGYRTIHTMDPENIRTVWGEKWQDWPVAPARQESMEPFCGLGFITTDGAEWKRFRNMLDPAFEDVNVSGLGELPEAFEQMLDRLPKDGESVDVVPYLEELVS